MAAAIMKFMRLSVLPTPLPASFALIAPSAARPPGSGKPTAISSDGPGYNFELTDRAGGEIWCLLGNYIKCRAGVMMVSTQV